MHSQYMNSQLEAAPDHVEVGLRAAKTVAMAEGRISDGQHRLLAAAARVFGLKGTQALDVAALEPITPEDVARRITDRSTRTHIVQAQMLVAMVDGSVSSGAYAAIQTFADALHVRDTRLTNLRQYVAGQHWRIKFDLRRRSPVFNEAVKYSYKDRGIKGFCQATAPIYLAFLASDRELAARFYRLEQLPEDTLGHQYLRHMRKSNLKLPGEKGGFSQEFVKHDCCHVLGSYNTDPSGECQVAAFITGFLRVDPFWYMFAALMQLHLGVQVFPGPPLRMGLDPELSVKAFVRGRHVNTDLYDVNINWWDYFEMPVDEVRKHFNVLPS